MDNQHDTNVEAGKKLLDAEDKLKKAEELMFEANLVMKRARDFESSLNSRQKKLDRAFYLLNRQKRDMSQRELRIKERETLLHDNLNQF